MNLSLLLFFNFINLFNIFLASLCLQKLFNTYIANPNLEVLSLVLDY